jgi:hypothetical protein
MIRAGTNGRFYWLVAPSSHPRLVELILRFHPSLRLCITAFDSGPIRPGPEELAEGWRASGQIMVSPPLVEGLQIPRNEYDECYILEKPPPPEWEPEIFVNYGGFTLVPSAELYKASDPTWSRYGFDELASIQGRFWEQLERVDPVSYIAVGDYDVVVTRRREFIERLLV